MQWLFEVIIWWLIIEIIGFVALPVTGYICCALPDRGYAVSKIMGLLLLTYFSWILTYIGFGYSTVLVFVSLILLSVISYIFYTKFGLHINRSFVIKNEFFFAVIFFAFLIIRSYSPDNYWEIGEKFMDVAFINSVLRSSTFPPMDPWFSGMSVNYYYFGYLMIADLIKLTGTALSAGFNIASAFFFALSASAVFGIGFALVKKIKFVLIICIFVLFLGNLVGFIQLLVILFFPAYYERFYVPDGDLSTRISTFSQWPSIKIIPDGLSEVPYHVYLIGDLHPNLVSISLQLLILSILLSIIIAKKISYSRAIMLSLIVGFLYPLNTWDYPTYIAITLVVIFLTTKSIKNSVLLSGLIVVLSYILYLPYHLNYKNVIGIAVVTSNRTELIHYLLIYGTFIFIISYYLINNNRTKKDLLKWLIYLTLLMSLAYITQFQLVILLVPLAFLAYSGMTEDKEPAKQFIHLLILIGALLGLFAELFYIQDNMSKLIYIRFNTIFKLYIQAWILLSIAASYAFYQMLQKKAVYIACILILMSSIYPILITINQSESFNTTPTLDGERSIKKEHPYEYHAIEWLREKNGTPVVLQATGFSGTWNSYVSTFTGLPTVLGWEWHEYQWRVNLEEINKRRSDVETAYSSYNYSTIKDIIYKYNISYVYIGHTERDRYKITDIFKQHKERFKLVYRDQDIEIYEVQ